MDNGQLQKIGYEPRKNSMGCHRGLQERHSRGHNIIGNLRSEGLLLHPQKYLEFDT